MRFELIRTRLPRRQRRTHKEHTVNPANNPPITAATITAAIVGLLAAFTTLGADQLAAIGAAVGIIAAIAAQRFTTPYKKPWV